MDSSEFFQLVASRSSVRSYSGQQVEQREVDFILRCASTAPSAGNREAWDVVVVTDKETRIDLADAALHQDHVADAPLILVVCANYTRSMSRYGERGILYAVQDATIACTYMMLAAHAIGLHTCWTGAFNEEEVRGLLALPVHVRPIALLAVGRGHLPTERTGRIPVNQHLHHEQW